MAVLWVPVVLLESAKCAAGRVLDATGFSRGSAAAPLAVLEMPLVLSRSALVAVGGVQAAGGVVKERGGAAGRVGGRRWCC